MYTSLQVFQIVISLSFLGVIGAEKTTRVAIIGTGIGGASTAYFLRQKQYDGQIRGALEIDVFEKQSIVGGRLAMVEINGEWYEAGGAIIHSKNAYMNDFLTKLGLEKHEKNDDGPFGIFDGKDLIFQTSKYSIVTLFKLLYKYGLNPYSMKRKVDHYVSEFEKIFDLLRINNDDARKFSTVADLLTAINYDFFNQTLISAHELFETYGLSEAFLRDMVEPIIRVNYGQHLNVHGFSGLIAVGGAQSGLWSVKGGNMQIPKNLLAESKASVNFHCNVDIVSKDENGKMSIKCADSRLFSGYDYVVCAFPLIKSNGNENVKFAGFDKPLADYGFVKYHKLVVTFVEGRLKHQFHGFDAILMCCDYDSLNSIGLVSRKNKSVSTLHNESRVYKIFSSNYLSDDEGSALNNFFERDFRIAKTVEWSGAYPNFEDEYDIVAKSGFEIYHDVFYLNAIEAAASAMEMSAISAKNIALSIGRKLSTGYKREKAINEEL